MGGAIFGFSDDPGFYRRLGLIQGFVGLVFGADLLLEFGLHFAGAATLDLVEIAHLGFETMAVGLLFYGWRLAAAEAGRLRRESTETRRKLRGLRGRFDDLLADRFGLWGLSAAERDVALLSFRGLRLMEIAEMRGARPGTVKAQMSAVFRKAGVSGRAELMALFMEEFLEVGAEPPASR